MAAFEWTLMKILTVVCTVYVCHMHAVTSQSGTVFSVIVQDAQSMNNFSFDSKGFTALYQCLCSANYDACQTTPLSDDLKDVRGCQHTNTGSSGNMYTECKIFTDVTCSRKDLRNIKCNQTIPQNLVICDNVQLEWNVDKKVALQSHTKNIDIQRCSRYKPNCIYLKTIGVNNFEQRDELLTLEINATASGSTPSIQSPSNPAYSSSPTTYRPTNLTVSLFPTPNGGSNTGNKEKGKVDIIISATVGAAVVVAIFVIIIIIWKRKKKSPSSSSDINYNSREDDDSGTHTYFNLP